MTQLTAKRVSEIFVDCLPRDDEEGDTTIMAEGPMNRVAFTPRRLFEYREEVFDLLMELPTEFRLSEGGGWSFLNACNDRHGNQWASLHETMERLFMLGAALGLVRSPFPRSWWNELPGGMPYYVIDDTQMEAS